MSNYEELHQSIVSGDPDRVKEIVRALVEQGKRPTQIIFKGLAHGMTIVGEKWKAGEMFIPEVIVSANALSEGMKLIKSTLTAEDLSSVRQDKVVIGTVEGDVHTIGKRIVAMILESGGFEVVDLGVDISAGKFVKAVENEQPSVLGLSSLLTTTMPRMKDVIKALTDSGLREKVKVIVGGAPITQAFADSIGADGYAPDAVSALDRVKQLLS